MTDRRDLIEAFSSAFHLTFGNRAIEVAEGQRDLANGIVQERWQTVIDVLTASASSIA
ncbi:hypothetical protein KZ820_07120 [Sphingomonas sp. RRHST34]|uniref:Uncharacterized protein n=1 Tax=Sphingomonas citri TaxID=2862499 RepID=A0ABS7BLL7_9SPHN|nr:hypothetical protein [Sphingomonas citri]MBW6530503.1 hypothetical protein [Sphingomonas citri]